MDFQYYQDQHDHYWLNQYGQWWRFLEATKDNNSEWIEDTQKVPPYDRKNLCLRKVDLSDLPITYYMDFKRSMCYASCGPRRFKLEHQYQKWKAAPWIHGWKAFPVLFHSYDQLTWLLQGYPVLRVNDIDPGLA